jgi:hypothetical protein
MKRFIILIDSRLRGNDNGFKIKDLTPFPFSVFFIKQVRFTNKLNSFIIMFEFSNICSIKRTAIKK